MPPHKQVRQLFNLCHDAIRDIVLSSCVTIEVFFPSARAMSFSVPGCAEAVLTVQAALRECIATTLWEDLFHAVMEHTHRTRVRDQRILYAIFIHDNVYISRLTINERLVNVEAKPFDVQNRRYIEFWEKRALMLTRLVVVDLTKVRSDEVVCAFSKACTELKVMTLRYEFTDETWDCILKHCKKLRMIDCRMPEKYAKLGLELLPDLEYGQLTTFKEFAKDISTRETTTQLKLRKITVSEESTGSQTETIICQCPNLERLNVFASRFDFNDIQKRMIFIREKLQNFKSLYVAHFRISNNSFSGCDCLFIEITNEASCFYITFLEISLNDRHNPLVALDFISANCQNLKKLVISSDYTATARSRRRRWCHRVKFPKLEHLSLRSHRTDIEGLALLTHQCTAHAENLSVFQLSLYHAVVHMRRIEATIVKLFSTSERLKQISELRLLCRKKNFKPNVARLVLEKCTNLKRLGITCDGAQRIQQEAKRRNWDIDFDILH